LFSELIKKSLTFSQLGKSQIRKGKRTMFEKYPDIVSIQNVCEMLSIGRTSAYSLLQTNQISNVRVGKKYIIRKDAIIGFASGSSYNPLVAMGIPSIIKEVIV